MVLALASTADAALSFYINDSQAPSSITIDTDEEITIQIYSSDTSNWLGLFALQWNSVGDISRYGNYPASGQDTIWPPPDRFVEPGWGTYYELATLSVSYPVQPGIQHSVDYSSSQAGSAVIGLFLGGSSEYSWDADEVARIDITVVPEPMTMSLLALGGALVLIRKRRT
jgi:hypothetical protein